MILISPSRRSKPFMPLVDTRRVMTWNECAPLCICLRHQQDAAYTTASAAQPPTAQPSELAGLGSNRSRSGGGGAAYFRCRPLNGSSSTGHWPLSLRRIDSSCHECEVLLHHAAPGYEEAMISFWLGRIERSMTHRHDRLHWLVREKQLKRYNGDCSP